MRDLEHPDVTRVDLTGYPRWQEMPTRATRCVMCKTEIDRCNENYYRLCGEQDFCSRWCLTSWLEKTGELTRVEVEDGKAI